MKPQSLNVLAPLDPSTKRSQRQLGVASGTQLFQSPLKQGTPSVTQIPQSAALILIDVQQAFLDHRFGERNNPQAEKNIARLLYTWRAASRRIFHVAHDSLEAGSLLHPGRPGNAIQPVAAPLPGEPIYRKQVNSAFIGTNLEKDLREAAIGTLIIVGLTTNHCVSTSVRMAGNLGFKTYVVSDATAAFARVALDGTMRSAEDVHSAALSDLLGEFATVLETDEIIKGLAPQ
jgi:nicotinamidase-related amidase